MKRELNNINAIINDASGNFVDNKAKSGGKVTFLPEENLLKIDFAAPAPPADMLTLAGQGNPSGIVSKKNNKNGKYNLNFSLTKNTLLTFGKKTIWNELKVCYDAIWADVDKS